MNDNATITLTRRFGTVAEGPSASIIRTAVDEVVSDAHHGVSEADLAEHPNAWLEFGYEDGENWTVVVVDYYRGGTLRLTKYLDQDDDDPVVEEVRSGVSATDAVAQMLALSAGDQAAVLAYFGCGET